ncbi:MAG: DUF4097 family beta strand repeat protein [Clostridia bacterium]|nr:DUF4097 family beta strand repeat protein [Clostridia bacterium]
MNKALKIILIIGLAVTLLGACMLFISLSLANWELSALSDTKIQEFTYTEPPEAPVTDVSLDFGNADINVFFDTNAETLIVTYPATFSHSGKPKTEITVTENNGSVSITEKIVWYRNIISLWDYSDPEVTLILPANRTYRLSIYTDNGEITVDTGDQKEASGTLNTDTSICNTSAVQLVTANGRIAFADSSYMNCEGEFLCRTDNGKIELGTVDAKKLIAESDNGMIMIVGGNITETVQLATANGVVRVTGTLTAHDIGIETDNGKIQLQGNLTANKMTVETDNGNITATAQLDAAHLTLTTDNGDITAYVAGKRSDYTVEAKTDVGKSNVASQTGGNRVLIVESDTGDIEISFLGNEDQ